MRDGNRVLGWLQRLLGERALLLVHLGNAVRRGLRHDVHVLLRVFGEVLFPHERDHANGDKRGHGRDEREGNRHTGGIREVGPNAALAVLFLVGFHVVFDVEIVNRPIGR